MPDVSGPFGGLLSVAYGAGCVSGWTFAMWNVKARLAEQKAEITELKAQVAKLNDFVLRGAERQMGQLRESTIHLLDRGKIIPPLGEDE